jgi:hypothetical protein
VTAPRTVDPTGEESSTKFLTLRVTETQAQRIEELAQLRGCSKSILIRNLITEEYERVKK